MTPDLEVGGLGEIEVKHMSAIQAARGETPRQDGWKLVVNDGLQDVCKTAWSAWWAA